MGCAHYLLANLCGGTIISEVIEVESSEVWRLVPEIRSELRRKQEKWKCGGDISEKVAERGRGMEGGDGQNCDLGATTQNGGQGGRRCVSGAVHREDAGEAPAGSGTRSFISKAVSFLCASISSPWLISVNKLGVFLVLCPTSHRATQPFAHNHC